MQTRPMMNGQDDELVFEAFREVRWSEVREWGFGEQEATAFLRMQHDAQRRSYAACYPGATWLIVERQGKPAGYCCVHRDAASIVLVDIALLPAFRGHGVGTALLLALQEEARARGVHVDLSVRPESPARRLYERLGFLVTRSDPTSIRMRWSGANELATAPSI